MQPRRVGRIFTILAISHEPVPNRAGEYRGNGRRPPGPDGTFLEAVWTVIARTAAKAGIAVVLGTERVVEDCLRATVLVIDRDGAIAGSQDQVQIDPSEEGTYAPGSGRHMSGQGRCSSGL